uniref:TRAP transporter small permease protein n=1 Tax=OCS116 cluster bacterium TaxID=2030921 RepID=A0A2A4Z009_9PROT
MSSLTVKIEFFIGATLLAIITFLVFIAAVMRFAGYPIIWSIDLAELLFIWLCFAGAVRAMRLRAHLGVDYLVARLGHKNRLIIESVLAVIFIAFMIVIAKEGYGLAVLNKERVFGDSGISYYYVTIAVSVGCFFLSLAIIANAVEAWRSRNTDDPVFIFAPKPSDDGPTQL